MEEIFENEVLEEEFPEKDRDSRGDRRRTTYYKTKARFEKVKDLCSSWVKDLGVFGKFRHTSEANKFVNAGTPKKTKTKNRSANYRHHGGYGKAVKYNRRDQRQIDSMEYGAAAMQAEEMVD